MPALYMATRLWTTTLPNSFWGHEVTVAIADLVTAVREQHEGAGKADDVRRSMQVLTAAGLAHETQPGREWVVNRRSLRRTGKDVPVAIADLVRKHTHQPPASPVGRRPKVTPGPEHPTLF